MKASTPHPFSALLFLFALAGGYRSTAQQDIHYFQGKQYVQLANVWHCYSPENDDYYKVVGNSISVMWREVLSSQDIAAIEADHHLTRRRSNRLRIYDYVMNPGSNLFALADSLALIGGMERIHISTFPHFDLAAAPGDGSDPDVNECWQPTGTLTFYSNTSLTFPYIPLTAWDTVTGSPSIAVAIIDLGGIDSTHRDLGYGVGASSSNYSNIWVNTDEIKGDGIDNDLNGYIDDRWGWNFLTDDADIFFSIGQHKHATAVAGMVAAKKGNGYASTGAAGGTVNASGVAKPGVKIMHLKIGDFISGTSTEFADTASIDDAILYAIDNGARIINMSFKTDPNPLIDTVINLARQSNVLVVAAAGNDGEEINHQPRYPSTHPWALCVGAHYSVPVDTGSGRWYESCYGPRLDMVAPGYFVCVLKPIPGQGSPVIPVNEGGGTSFAAPLVAGAAALMFEINPCLSAKSAKELLMLTANRGSDINMWHHPELGYGGLNATAAVHCAKMLHSSSLDLYMKDSAVDFGIYQWPTQDLSVPEWAVGIDNSPDIWVRNQPDGLDSQFHQQPEYTAGDSLYVYVRVRNKSCVTPTSGTLQLYWTKAANNSAWPANFMTAGTGGAVGVGGVSGIPGGGEKIFQFAMPFSSFYSTTKNPCLLAVINNVFDLPTDYPGHLDSFVFVNNNVAMRNLTVVDVYPGKPRPIAADGSMLPYGGHLDLVNPKAVPMAYDFVFEIPDRATASHLITSDAEVSLRFFNSATYAQFVNAGAFNQQGVIQVGNNTVLLKQPRIAFQNIPMPAGARWPVYVGFSFLADSMNNNREYHYRSSAWSTGQGSHRLGSENYTIRKTARSPFGADAGPDKLVAKNSTTTVSAEDIGETAIYNWYDSEGNLVHIGKNLVLTPEMTERYRLEVLADADGWKDYDSVEVKVKSGTLGTLAPNPTSGSITIDYTLENVTSAYLMIVPSTGGTTSMHILDATVSSINLNLSSLATGLYNVVLVCDGVVQDVEAIERQ